ncbi:transcriptional regulator [uncultured Lamprocystis sp.]|jgi:predicted transcriptional regulator|uniref:HVO_A0114 family putative DNA-binding protein n=1 Tax=uncultured Lamprocystis sp. TaxID=543132 RepID=UPI0025F6861C|nr:transcriptional regulator [uncultured Lamprocystis sp.]
MAERTLTITVNADWQGALRVAAREAFGATAYRGETLNFETPGAFFGKLTERRWALLRLLQGTEEMSERELARRAARDVKRVHEDVSALADLGLVERTERGGIVCPFADIHVDMHLREAV